MKHSKQIKIAWISSYPPPWSRVASHTFRLIRSMTVASGGCLEPVILEVQPREHLGSSNMAAIVIHKYSRRDYMETTDFINSGDVDIVLLQHEFSLFGGNGGDYIALLLSRLNVPVMTTLHSITDKPTQACFQCLREICNCSCKVIVMNKQDITVLRNLYDIPESNIEWIPRGASPVLHGGPEDAYQHQLFPQDQEQMAWSEVGRAYWNLVKTQMLQRDKKQTVEFSRANPLNTALAEPIAR